MCVQTVSLADLNNIVSRFIENENLGIDPKRPLLEAKEILDAKMQLHKGVRKKTTGFEAKLLWKSDDRPQCSNKAYAMKRLHSFSKKMAEDPELQKRANEIIKKYLQQGYITEIREPHRIELEWFLPVFAVQSTSKTRLVWDAAARHQGTSLNQLLLKGPDLNEPLWDILHRFREHPIALCADVSEMFHRISIAAEDRKYQRFLWKYDHTGKTYMYEMNVQTFGAVCSPCISQFVKN